MPVIVPPHILSHSFDNKRKSMHLIKTIPKNSNIWYQKRWRRCPKTATSHFKMPFLKTILSTIRLPKKSSKSSKHDGSKSNNTLPQSQKAEPKDDQRNLYENIETWLESTKDAPLPGHRFNGHTLGTPKLTLSNLAMLNDGLRPMPVFGPEILTEGNLKMFEVG